MEHPTGLVAYKHTLYVAEQVHYRILRQACLDCVGPLATFPPFLTLRLLPPHALVAAPPSSGPVRLPLCPSARQASNSVYAFDLRTGAFTGTVLNLDAEGTERIEQMALSA